MHRRFLSSLIAIVMCAWCAAPVAALSLPGKDLDEATKEDFFQFFHMQKRAMDERDDLITHYFRPSSRGDVVVSVDTNKQGIILQMGLIVGRDFIDDQKSNVFARDLVKSFIEVATPEGDADETRGVINEIFFRGFDFTPTKVNKVSDKDSGEEIKMGKKTLVKIGSGELTKGDVAIMIEGKMPELPKKVSDCFKAFEGKVENADLPITGAHLVFKNHEVAKGKFLEVRVDVDTVKKVPRFEVVGDDPVESKSDEKKPEENHSEKK